MQLFNKLLFNLWYFRNPPWDTGISPPELMDFIHSHPAGRALDLGCGTGTNVITLARHGWQASGVDFARQAIRIARDKARRARVQVDLRVEDVTRLATLSGPFDLILDIGCFHSLPGEFRQAYLNNIQRFLSPEGTYLLYLFFKLRSDEAGPGVTEGDVENLSTLFHLVSRQDGTNRGERPSAWLTFQKPKPRSG
jgi:SAM-dependent methyltransferase